MTGDQTDSDQTKQNAEKNMEEIIDSMLVTRALMPSAFTCVQCHTVKKN